jgi:hypothetical protein
LDQQPKPNVKSLVVGEDGIAQEAAVRPVPAAPAGLFLSDRDEFYMQIQKVRASVHVCACDSSSWVARSPP